MSERGFSLLELVIVIVFVAIAAVPLWSFLGGAARALGNDKALQTANAVAQACGEHLLGRLRDPGLGFDAIDAKSCDPLPAPPAGFTRTLTLTPVTADPPCPAMPACTRAAITVSQGPRALAELDLLLIRY